MISARENYMRAVEFREPEWIPVSTVLPSAVWRRHREALEDIVLSHPLICGAYERGSKDFDEGGSVGYYRDDWGCLWHRRQGGMMGQVVGHPLPDWQALETFRPPDPREQFDWHGLRERTERDRQNGLLARGALSISQGGFFDRLQFLRGLENLLVDFVTNPPQLPRLIEMVLDYNMTYIHLWLEIGVDVMYIHGDIGTQRGLLMSPKTFRKVLKPAYKEMFMACRNAGAHVYYSSDGNLLTIVDDLIECGVSIHDPQARACTIEGIAQAYQGKMCVKVDLDEQMFPFCTPADIRKHVREVVEKLWLPQGGLMVCGEPTPDVPLENIGAICSALEEFRCYSR